MEEGTRYRNQISNVEKVFAGILLSLLTLLAITAIIAFWPDKLPPSGSTARYDRHLFNVTLLDSACINYGATLAHPINNTVAANNDTSRKAATVSKTPNVTERVRCTRSINIRDTIQFNTLMLLLVAISGFLGNMVHIATSFTTFVGAGQFKRSWLMWYCVKPFTAAALAVIVYFAFRAGFLNSNDPGNTLNIYGIMTISALAGLFTDIATQKLKEIFEVMFRPQEARPDSLKDDKDTNPE